jgi:PAS domain S-box-containing protein
VPEKGPAVGEPALAAPRWAPRLPGWLWAVLFLLALWGLRLGALAFTDGRGGIAVVWPAAGLLAYAFLVTRRRAWPALFLVALAGGVADSVHAGRTLAQAVAYNGGAAATSVASAWLVARLAGRPTLRTVRGTAVFVVAPALASAAASLVSRAALSAAGASFPESRFWVYWGGLTLGVVLVTSLLIEWSEPAPAGPVRPRAALSIAAIVAGLGAGLALMELPSFPPTGQIVLLPPLVWAALRFGQRGATTAVALGTVGYLVAWADGGGSPGLGATALGVQLFFGFGAVSIFVVAAVGEERRTAEARRAVLQTAMDHSPAPAGIIREDGRIVWANESTARTLGVPRASLVGGTVFDLGEDPVRWRAVWARAAEGPVIVPLPRGLAGPLVHGQISAGVVDVDGERLMVAVLHDLTDRHRAEEASRLAGLGTLAAGVAHEINNPLSYVVSNLAHLTNHLSRIPDRDGSLRAEVLEPLAEAEDGARRVRDIVRQLGAFARADEGSGPVDPARVLRGALAVAGNEVRHRARIVTAIEPTPPVVASESRLGQVFLNLLVNAAQAIPDGSAEQHEIRVTLSGRGADVVLEVADTGNGMSAETRARIFEPFFTTRAPGGSGLGLAIAHSIVTRLGGRIEVESSPGEGSVFRVVLPAASGLAGGAPELQLTPPPPTARRGSAASPRSLSAAPPPGPATPRLRILVVDDDPLVARALARLLAGHEVATAQHGRDALERLRAGERFDAVVCDLMMPDLSGMELHAAVAEIDPGLADRFIFITGGAFTESARDFLARARNPRLEKPVDRGALDAALRHVAQA